MYKKSRSFGLGAGPIIFMLGIIYLNRGMKYSSLLRNHAFAGGKWVSSETNRTFEVRNPSNSAVVASVPDMNEHDVRQAILAAHAAWPAYRLLSAKERAQLLRNLFEIILANREALAELMTIESGKVITESLGEVSYGAAFIEWFAEEARRAYGDIIPASSVDRRLMVIKQPVGVVAAITPWNFPLAMITRKAGPALAAGCPIVIKPASETPLTALALASFAEEAGFPAGTFNVVTSTEHSAIGKLLCEDPLVRKVSFTGSTRVGKILMAQCSQGLKKITLELGGNAPFIVFDDADVDAAVKGAVASKFRHNGQTCVCVNRVLVQDKVYNEFVEKFVDAVSHLKTGDVMRPDVQIGPLIHNRGLEKVQMHIADALSKGAKVATGGNTAAGLVFQPTVLVDANSSMMIAQEEVFGPVAPVFRFETEAEAIEMANDTSYGLAAYFYSRDLNRCIRVAEALEYGMVGVNEGIISTEVAPFGGVKESGFGREGSKYGMDDYLEKKYICYGGIR